MHAGQLIAKVELHGALHIVIQKYRFVFVLKLESDFHL